MTAPRHGIFGTLQECLDTVRKDHSTSAGHDRILYRGEASVYPHTHSLIFRITHEHGVIPKNQIDYLVDTLHEIHTKLNLVLNEIPVFATPEEALTSASNLNPSDPIEVLGAFLQHYYLPTPLLDVTDDFDTAANFAAYPVEGIPEDQPHPGRFYVFNGDELLRAGRQVYSLKKSKAQRPRIQQAYSLSLRAGDDLQNLNHFPYPQVERYDFVSANSERRRFFKPKLMNARGDRVAREVGYCCQQMIQRDWGRSDSDRRAVLRFYDGVCGKLIQDEAHLD